jgi:Ca2+-binding EF-hand superfamily protein
MTGVTVAQHGTFGNGQSLWIWKAKQGTASGRLRPVTDMRLEPVARSSDLVILGYTCLTTPVGGQHLWVKHAQTSEEAADGITDFRVTLGRSRSAADSIWTSPGVGWNHVEGNFNKTMFGSSDAFLWFRPLKPRTNNWEHSVGAMTEENRQALLLRAVRTAVRNHIPIHVLPGVANRGKSLDATDSADNNTPRAPTQLDNEFDFTNFFVMYNGTKNTMNLNRFRNILHDVGAALDRPDQAKIYNHMDCNQDNAMSRKEYAAFAVLTDYELDLVIDDIRHKLLIGHVLKTGKNPLRQSRILAHIFKHFNTSKDNVLSQSELSAMCSTLQIFLVGEELQKIMQYMDIDKDGRVEESDFLRFFKADSNALSRKAHRIHEAAMFLRRWLVRGSASTANVAVGVSPQITLQWAELKKRCEKISGGKFPGYLSAQDLQNILAHQGMHLSFQEASELALVIAPHRNARIQEADLEGFMKGSCRSLGELVAIVERDTMRTVVDSYRNHCTIMNADGVADEVANRQYTEALQDILTRIMASQASEVGAHSVWEGAKAESNKAARSASTDVVSISQLKAGIEASMGRPPNSPLPNHEEWAIMAVLVGGATAQDDLFGVNAKKFVEGLCEYVSSNKGNSSASTSVLSLDALCSQLRIMIKDEALALGRNRTADYLAVFNTFDIDGGGAISLEEFTNMLNRMQLIDSLSKKQVPQLLRTFDKANKGSISFDDFLRFVESGKEEDEDLAMDDDGDDTALLGLGSNVPPAHITHNSECDWLLWYVWRQACRTSHRDPESAISNLEAACTRMAKDGGGVMKDGQYTGLSSEAFWQKLGSHNLQGGMTRAQYESGVHFVCMDGSGRSDDPVDFLSLCRYFIRMGRAYNSLIQERRNVDSRKFKGLFASLQQQLIKMDATRTLVASEASTSKTQQIMTNSYFERVLRRQDSNRDGLLTVPEFKLGLRRMQIKDERLWSKAMVRKLFEETDNRSDGLVCISEFGKVIRGDYSRDSEKQEDLSDDEDDLIFSTQRQTPDAALQRKVSSILMDLVPLSGTNGSPNSISTHCEAVRSAIYRFFGRHDPTSNGLIAEEHFHVFARKSGLQSRLRGGEFRRVVGKLRVRGAGRDSASIDYEKLCRMVSPNSDSAPRARVDALMLQLQEAARVSASADRSFLNLCTLADPRFTGLIASEELCIVCKMMGCPLTTHEIDMIRELQNNQEGHERQNKGNRMVDYRRLSHLIESYVPGAMPSLTSAYGETKEGGVFGASAYRVRSRDGALPAYATPSGVTRVPPSPSATISLDHMRGIHTPGAPTGRYMTTPGAEHATYAPGTISSFGPTVRLGMGGTMGSVERGGHIDAGLNSLAARLRRTGDGRGADVLSRRCQEADGGGTGLLSESALQSIFEDLAVQLSPADLHIMRSRFQVGGNGRLDYSALCRSLSNAVASAQTGHKPMNVGFASVLASPAMAKRMQTIRQDGISLQTAFADADMDNSGTMDVRRFSDMLLRMNIVQTERQLCLAVDEYACNADRSRVNYQEFLESLNAAENTQRRILDNTPRGGTSRLWAASPMGDSVSYTPLGRPSVMGAGYDGLTNRSVGSGDGGDSMRPPRGALDTTGWNDDDSVRTEIDSLTGGGIAIGRNVAISSSGNVGTWMCHICSHELNSIDSLKCSVCDSAKNLGNANGTGGATNTMCANCKFSNTTGARTCQICDLAL